MGIGLDTLVNDPSMAVRTAVARHGYKVDVLINDDHPLVRQEAELHYRRGRTV